MIRFHVNIDHVATVRNARGTAYPDPVLAAQLCELAGADGITAHLREDRRHIRDEDVLRLRQAVRTLLNLEMAATDEMIAIAERLRPDVISLVPERREERTTEGGLDVVHNQARITEVRRMCDRAGIRLSLFIAADLNTVEVSRQLGANQVEFHTGDYCDAASPEIRKRELEKLAEAVRLAAGLGLDVAAGHGLNRHNVGDVAALSDVKELNIGHAVISDALFLGLDGAVKAFRAAIQRGEQRRPERG